MMPSRQRGPGRPRVLEEIQRLVIRMATENRDWGYRTIQGALANLGHEVARGTIANILKEHGLEPAPERKRKTTWKEFLSRRREVIVAADFFTIEASSRGLTRFLVLFLIDLASRRVEIAGIARHANGLWMSQVATRFMKSFYSRLRRCHDKALALRSAMLELRQEYPHPYFWAPFLLVGKASA